MRCPNCKLENPPEAQRCDCGFDFADRTGKHAPLVNISQTGDAKNQGFTPNTERHVRRCAHCGRKVGFFSSRRELVQVPSVGLELFCWDCGKKQRAAQRQAERAERRVTSGKCELCAQIGAGRFYSFCYAKHLGTRKTTYGNLGQYTTITITNYQVGGIEKTFVCRRCVGRQQRKIFLFVLGSAAIIAALRLIEPVYKHLPWIPFAAFMIIIFAVLGIMASIGQMISAGLDLAIEMKRKHFAEMGYNSFLKPRQYKKLSSPVIGVSR